jgi:hypothetical protein
VLTWKTIPSLTPLAVLAPVQRLQHETLILRLSETRPSCR